MANGGGHWWDNAWENLPSEWSDTEAELFQPLVSESEGALANDRLAQALYDEAMFNMDLSRDDRFDIMETLRDYLWEEYEIDFDDIFDWEGWREVYDTAG